MIFKGTISVIGDDGNPLPVNCEVTDHRLMITTRDGAVIGDWGLREIAVHRTGNGFTIRAEGEQLRLRIDHPEALAQELHLDETSNIAERVAAAQQSPPTGERIRWGIVAAVVGALIVAGVVLVAVIGVGPFERDSAPEAAPATGVAATSVTTPSPPTTKRTTTTACFRDVWYFVEGTTDLASTVTLTNSSGNSEQWGDIQVPLAMQGEDVEGFHIGPMQCGTFVYLAAQNGRQSGTITCRIEADGVTIEQANSSGGYVIAGCSGTVR